LLLTWACFAVCLLPVGFLQELLPLFKFQFFLLPCFSSTSGILKTQLLNGYYLLSL